MTIKPGRESTEHTRALRAEMLGAILALTGAAATLQFGSWAAVALAGVGAALMGWANHAYARSRGEVKAAAVRRPVDQAPRI